jgi:hypothetical protein
MAGPSPPLHTAKIAFLASLYADECSPGGGMSAELVELARGIAAAGRFSVDVIAFGSAGRVEELAPGVRLRVLPMAFAGGHPLDVLSWELPSALDEADLVHLHQPFTRTGEMGMLLAKLRGKPVCVTARGGGSSALGEAVEFLALADCVLCGAESLHAGAARSVRVEWDDPARAGRQLARVYRRLLGRGAEAA